MSALPSHTSSAGNPATRSSPAAWPESASPVPNAKIRECSRNRPSTLRTRMFSDRPGMPGRSAHIPRTHTSTGTPACDARYSASITTSSTSALHLNWIMAGSPARRRAAWRPIRATMPVRSDSGATSSRR